jgi:hypothetical protein
MGIPWLLFGAPELAKSRGIKGFPPRTPLSRNLSKPTNQAPFIKDLRWGHKEKNHKGFMYTSPTESQRERPQIHHKKIAKKVSERHQKGKMRETTQGLEEPRC